MSTKIVNICISEKDIIPEIINSFTPEENYMMIKIGSDCIREGRKVVSTLSQKEIYDTLKKEFCKDMEKLEMDLLVEKRLKGEIQEEARIFYKNQIDTLNKRIEQANQQIKKMEEDIDYEYIQKEINKTREKFDIMYKSKEQQLDKFSELYEKILLQNTNKTSSYKGTEGETKFEDLAKIFIDFKGYNIEDKHKQSGQGDFHLHFEEFDVLVDAKNYNKNVHCREIEKIKRDLEKNNHINFAWLISLNTPIDKWDRSPIMYEWINSSQCVVYVNNLLSFEDPTKILRIVWFTCKELSSFTNDLYIDSNELTKLKDERYKVMDKIKGLRKKVREINTTINTTKNLMQLMDDELKEMLDKETTDIVESSFNIFDEWWDKNIELTNDDITTSSTIIWTKFKQDNKELMKNFEITVDNFKQYVKTKISHNQIIIKSKNANTAYDIKGIKIVENNNEKKNVKQNKKDEYYFNEEIDMKIIEQYKNTNNDILSISKKNKIKTYQVVSLLLKNKIINKRVDARGYDKYKETEEYKNKINKKTDDDNSSSDI